MLSFDLIVKLMICCTIATIANIVAANNAIIEPPPAFNSADR